MPSTHPVSGWLLRTVEVRRYEVSLSKVSLVETFTGQLAPSCLPLCFSLLYQVRVMRSIVFVRLRLISALAYSAILYPFPPPSQTPRPFLFHHLAESLIPSFGYPRCTPPPPLVLVILDAISSAIGVPAAMPLLLQSLKASIASTDQNHFCSNRSLVPLLYISSERFA